MKFISTLLLAVCVSPLFSQSYFNIGYGLSAPQQQMDERINVLHSIQGGISFRAPKFSKHLQFGAEASWGTYAVTSKEQTFTFRDGSTTRTMVNYSSNVLQGALNAQWMLLKDKAINPYLTAKAGYASFYSTIFIEDPHDPDGCRALDQRTLLKDGTVFGGYGGGLRMDTWIFNRKAYNKGRGFIDFRVQNVRGNKVDYINTKKLYDAANPPVAGDGKAVNVQFINATTNEIHEHQVAEVYSTPLRMLEYRISWVFMLD